MLWCVLLYGTIPPHFKEELGALSHPASLENAFLPVPPPNSGIHAPAPQFVALADNFPATPLMNTAVSESDRVFSGSHFRRSFDSSSVTIVSSVFR
jgi:hypothetical protein